MEHIIECILTMCRSTSTHSLLNLYDMVVVLSKNSDFSARKPSAIGDFQEPVPGEEDKIHAMLKRLLSVPLFFSLFLLLDTRVVSAQCHTAIVNWENLDYLEANSANYSAYITPALYPNLVQRQSFAIGINRVTITHNFVTASNLGENVTHTGEAGSYGTGADVNYSGNGTITLTFDNAVSNFKMSLYDVDASARTQVSALNASGASINVTLSPATATWATSVFVPNPATSANTSVGLNPRVDATLIVANQANNTITSTVNIDVAGPVKTITIVVSNNATDPLFWMSDIQACVTGSYPTNYYNVSQPFTGQPSYVLAVHDLNTVYMLDPATGRAVDIFTDNSPRVREINNLAYDPYKRIIYYSVDGLERCTPAGSTDSVRYVRKYDVNTGTISEIVSNVNNAPLYIPTYSYGLESGSAAFYNGSLFLGVEGTKSGSTSTGREGTIWRVDFAVDSITPTVASQVFAQPADNGTRITHDWGDIVINDSILYDFNRGNASGSPNTSRYHVYDLQTEAITTYTPLFTYSRPTQAAVQWNGQLCWVSDSVATYDGTNVVGATKKKIFAAPRNTTWVAAAGDAAEAFRPKADFGDAPASYDPVALSPALNERDTALRIGATCDLEWSKNTSSDASGDGADEDGIAFVSIFDPATQNYLVQVQVYNHTDSVAKLCAWLDYNGNGVFDAAEGLTPISVPSSTATQSFFLWWSGIISPLANGSYTYLRVRIATNANSMTTSKATGYMFDGETEDYRVLVDNFPLGVNLLSFTAKAVNSTTARLNWTTTLEDNFSGFGIERSADGTNWTSIGFVSATGNSSSSQTDYLFNDIRALRGKSFYRLKLQDKNGQFRYSEQRTVTITDMADQVIIMPNPASTTATVYLKSNNAGDAFVSLFDVQGRKLRTEKLQIVSGGNTLVLRNLDQLPEGTYIVQVVSGQEVVSKKLLIGKGF